MPESPLEDVKRSNLKRWLLYRVNKLPKRNRALVIMHRGLTEHYTTLGLFHDTRTKIYREEDHPLMTHTMPSCPPDVQKQAKAIESWLS